VGALLYLHFFHSAGEAVPIRRSLDAFPSVVGRWQGREASVFDVETLNSLRAKDYLLRRFVDPTGRSLWLYIGYWDTQRKGAQIHSPKNCLPGSGWEPLEAGRVAVPLRHPYAPITVNRYVIQKDKRLEVVLYWYDAQGQAIAGEIPAKIQTVKSAIFRNRTDGALIRVSSPVYGSVPETSDLLVKYVQALYPLLGDYLPN
jgi:EpsI family protein